jgi:hypothetical protein
MKQVFLTAALSWIAICPSSAQSCAKYPFAKVGNYAIYTLTNGAGKELGTQKQSVKDVKSENKNTVATILSEESNGYSKGVISSEFGVQCVEKSVLIDLRAFIMRESISAMQGMDIKSNGAMLEFPTAPTVGTALPDGKLTLTLSQGGMPMGNLNLLFKNRKVAATESITTAAGTYTTFLITSDCESSMKMMGTNQTFQITTKHWFSKDLGIMVKSEAYRDNALVHRRELTSIKK